MFKAKSTPTTVTFKEVVEDRNKSSDSDEVAVRLCDIECVYVQRGSCFVVVRGTDYQVSVSDYDRVKRLWSAYVV